MGHNARTAMEDPSSESGPPDREAARRDDAALVAAALAGDQAAFGRLFDRWYDRVFNLARGIVRDDEVAAEVAQDAFLSAWKNLATLEDHLAFGGWLLRIARNASFNRQARESRSVAVDDEGMAMIESSGLSPSGAPAGFRAEQRLGELGDPSALAGDAELTALVWQAAAALGERDSRVFDLQMRYGLSPAEIGDVMGINRNAANQLCHRLRQRFTTALQARVLWNGRRPACDDLAALLASAGVDSFDAEAVKIADRHAASCDICGERRELRLQPSALFASIPIVVAPVLFKTKAAAALEAAGVPMGGSSFGTATAHDGDGIDSDGTDGDADRSLDESGDTSPAQHRRLRRTLAMTTCAAIVVLALVLILGDRVHHEDDLEVASEAPVTTIATTASTAAPTTASTTPPTAAVEPPPTETTSPPLVPPAGSTPTSSGGSPAPPAVTIDVAMTPSSSGTVYVVGPDSPTLTWRVTGAATVQVEGPSGKQVTTLATGAEGRTRVCPGTLVRDACRSPAGTYTYRVAAFDGDGNVLADQTVDLLIA
jgi:RNA polymerase sigma factor (sigma-70 family)